MNVSEDQPPNSGPIPLLLLPSYLPHGNSTDSFLGLRKAVAYPSVSADDDRRPDVVKVAPPAIHALALTNLPSLDQMSEFLVSELKSLGALVESRPLGPQLGKPDLQLPPVIVARHGSSPNKRTILVYGHYDVQPALKDDGWSTEPFALTVDDKGRMYGRGSTDDKGPVLGWLNAIQAHQAAGIELPVNLLMCFEGMEESGSEGLDDFIEKEAKKGGFFEDAVAVCISDNYWLGTKKPCLTYGLRGCNYYSLSVKGPGQDLHSGIFGGIVHEPMTDLVRVLGKLVDTDGKILIPGIQEMVAPMTDDEQALYADISYTMANLYESLGSTAAIYDTTEETLMARWRYPSLSIHGVEGAFSAPGAKTVIPAKVVGKFSIRTVPDMKSDRVDELVFKYVEDEFKKLRSKNTVDISLQSAGNWWVASPKHWNFTAAGKAAERVFGVKPDLTREGGRYEMFVSICLSFHGMGIINFERNQWLTRCCDHEIASPSP